jgi:hypothetical protein
VKNYTVLGVIIAVAIAFYLVIPKYELFQSAGDGTVTYRFNKITGTLQSCDMKGNKWKKSTPAFFIKRPI